MFAIPTLPNVFVYCLKYSFETYNYICLTVSGREYQDLRNKDLQKEKEARHS